MPVKINVARILLNDGWFHGGSLVGALLVHVLSCGMRRQVKEHS